MAAENQVAPDFDLLTDAGTRLRLSKLRGKAIVLYFYPKDDTSGCTAEAKDFSALGTEFTAAGVKVVGVSPDTTASKARFRKKHALTVELAADADKAVATAYGVWVEKSMYGRKYMGVERSTFLIDRDGRIVQSWRKVRVSGHAAAVLAAAQALNG